MFDQKGERQLPHVATDSDSHVGPMLLVRAADQDSRLNVQNRKIRGALQDKPRGSHWLRMSAWDKKLRPPAQRPASANRGALPQFRWRAQRPGVRSGD